MLVLLGGSRSYSLHGSHLVTAARVDDALKAVIQLLPGGPHKLSAAWTASFSGSIVLRQ